MLYEIRRYRIRPGRRDDWVAYMEAVVLPFQGGGGMDLVASFIDADDPDAYVWIRRFQDDADRERRYQVVYESDRWRDEIGPRVGDLLIREDSVITTVTPTSASPLR